MSREFVWFLGGGVLAGGCDEVVGEAFEDFARELERDAMACAGGVVECKASNR